MFNVVQKLQIVVAVIVW